MGGFLHLTPAQKKILQIMKHHHHRLLHVFALGFKKVYVIQNNTLMEL
jgi:hypothetical protein